MTCTCGDVYSREVYNPLLGRVGWVTWPYVGARSHFGDIAISRLKVPTRPHLVLESRRDSDREVATSASSPTEKNRGKEQNGMWSVHGT